MLKKRPVGHKTAIFLITALFLINSASYGIDLSNDNISQPLVFAKDSPAQESEIFRNKILLDWRQRAVFLSITSHYLIDKGNNADLVNALREKLRGVEEHYKDLPVWREAPDGNALAVRIFYTADDVDCIATVTRKTVEGAEKYVISVEKDSTSDLKGRDAPASDPLIQKLIEEHSVVEVYIDPASGALNAARLKPVEDYRPMETPSVLYRGEGIDIFQLFTRSQQKILADLMKKHRVRGSPVKFRIVLGNAALGWSEDEALNSNIAHAGIYDGVIYCGGTLLKELLNGRNGDLREAIIVDDEFAHLQGYDHAMDESYQARLAAVSSLIAREELESIARAMRENDVTFLIDRLRARLEEPLKLLSMLAILNEVSLSQPDHPVESRYPIKTAASLLDKEEQAGLLEILLSEESKMEGYREQIVVDELILMFADAGTLKVEFKDWIRVHAPELEGRSLWQISPEIWHEAGGLARVMQYHGTAILKLIGLSDVRFRQIEPHYQKRVDPDPSKPSKPLDYTDPGQVAHPIQGPLIESDHFTVSVGGKDIDVVVNVGVNDLGIEVCLIRDVQPDGSSFFTDSLYNYRQSWEHGKRLPTWEEFSVFYSKAALEFVRRVEAKEKVEKEEAGFEWKAPVIHLNDSQTALVSIYRKILLDIENDRQARDPEYRLDPVLEGAVVCFTTHTYGNRTQYGTRDGYGDGMLDYMEIPAKYRRLFERDNWKLYDMASAGLRSSDWQGVVAWAHCKDVRDNDEWVSDHGNRAALELEAAMDDPTLRVDLVAVTNGDHRSNTAVVFREHLRDLFGENVDWEHSSPDQIIEVKKAAKRALRVSGNKAYYTSKDQSESGGRILDPDQLVVSYSGRLVPEKTGRGYDGMGSDGRGAFDNDNIRWLVARGVQVVIYGNVQAGNPTSDEMARRLMDLAEELKGWTAHGVGRLVFVPRFSLTDERVLKAASDMGVHDSFPGTEAAGFTESNDAAAGGLVMAPLRAGKHYNDGTGEGLFEAQGLRLDMDNPGHGNTFVPETLDSGGYMKEFKKFIELKNRDTLKNHQAASVRLSRKLEADLTGAEYLRQFSRAVVIKGLRSEERIELKKKIEREEARKTIGERVLKPDQLSEPEAYLVHEIPLLVKDGDISGALRLLFTSEAFQCTASRKKDVFKLSAGISNILIKAYVRDEAGRGNVKAFFNSIKAAMVDFADTVETSQTVQLMAGQALTICSWIDRGIPGADEMRLTVDPVRMAKSGDKDRGMSFMDFTTLPEGIKNASGKEDEAGFFNREDTPGFYWRGIEKTKKLGNNILECLKTDRGRFKDRQDNLVMYLMNHGFIEVPEVLLEATERGEISTMHETYFLNDLLPGSCQTTSTGAGHLQTGEIDVEKVKKHVGVLDIKHVTEGLGVQVNIRFDKNGNMMRPALLLVKAGDECVSLPGCFDYMINLGGLRFNDISCKLSPRDAKRFVPEMDFSEVGLKNFEKAINKSLAEGKIYAPYVGMIRDGIPGLVKTRPEAPGALYFVTINGYIFEEKSLIEWYRTMESMAEFDKMVKRLSVLYGAYEEHLKGVLPIPIFDAESAERKIKDRSGEAAQAPSLERTDGINGYIDDNADFIEKILGEIATSDKLLQIPVDGERAIAPTDGIKNFLASFQATVHGYVRLVSTEGLPIDDGKYSEYGITRQELSAELQREGARDNTITVLPVVKGEKLPESDKNRLWQAASGVLSPQNTIIAPVGINYDAAGIIRSVFLGLKLSEIARDGEYTAESGFVKAALADYKALSLALGQEAREFNLRGEDLVNMARGKTMEIIVTSLNRLIKLLLIMPVNIEEQREIYEHAREVLARA